VIEFSHNCANPLDSHRNATPSGNLVRRYVHGPAADEPLVWYEGSGTGDRRYFHTDARGSVVALSDGAGGSLGTFAYGPYGESAGGSFSRFGYTGQMAIPGTDLLHFKARAYAPDLGRFLQPDPVGFAGGDLNLYAYAGNDPINFTDPTGLIRACVSHGNEDGTETITRCRELATVELGESGGGGFMPSSGARGDFGAGFGSVIASLSDMLLMMIMKEHEDFDPLHSVCTGRARVLDGNPDTIGEQGGFPGIPVRAGSAAVIPRQFTGFPNAGPRLRSASFFISGVTASGQRFNGLSDTVGNKDPDFLSALEQKLGRRPTQLDAQNEIRNRDPGLLIIELIDGANDLRENVTLRLPRSFTLDFGCPEGTG